MELQDTGRSIYSRIFLHGQPHQVAERREGEGGEQRAVQQRCAREQALPAFAAYRLCLPVRPADTATYKRFADLAQRTRLTVAWVAWAAHPLHSKVAEWERSSVSTLPRCEISRSIIY
jgi:hypothetical protein